MKEDFDNTTIYSVHLRMSLKSFIDRTIYYDVIINQNISEIFKFTSSK